MRVGRLWGRNVSRIAWSLWLATVLLLALGILLGADNGGGFFDAYAFLPMIMAFATVGLIISARMPQNAIGWLFCAFGLTGASLIFLKEGATYALLQAPNPLLAGEWVAWVFTWILELSWGPLIFTFLLFPHGHLLSPRWRPLAWFAVGVILIGGVTSALSAVNFANNFPFAQSPISVMPLKVARVIYDTYQLVMLAILATSAAYVIVRLHRSRGDERQQLKWFTYTVAIIIVAFTVTALLGIEPVIVSVVMFPFIPISVGVAILKYRLYDIDIVINRTLVYGSLTATLVALYFGGIVLLQRVFVVLTGEKSTLAVVASTLLIAALFNPLRMRIQGFIDRRFYRKKYDARKTLETFSSKLRDETDLEALSEELAGVVRETMQPAHVSIWLRPDAATRRDAQAP
jgi:hypothetical protein